MVGHNRPRAAPEVAEGLLGPLLAPRVPAGSLMALAGPVGAPEVAEGRGFASAAHTLTYAGRPCNGVTRVTLI